MLENIRDAEFSCSSFNDVTTPDQHVDLFWICEALAPSKSVASIINDANRRHRAKRVALDGVYFPSAADSIESAKIRFTVILAVPLLFR